MTLSGRILGFHDFLNESMTPKLRKSFDISSEEWEVMRLSPETGIPDHAEEYFRGSKAKTMVEKMVNFVSSGIFKDPPEVTEFMLNIAAVESCYGIHPGTYRRPNQTKGIFQLDKNGALSTIGYKGKSPVGNFKVKAYIAECKRKVKDAIGLDMDLIPYDNISKPLYNTIYARIYIGLESKSYKYDKTTNKITVIDHPIPKDKEGQAKWWKKRYNTAAGDGEEAKFINPPGCNIA